MVDLSRSDTDDAEIYQLLRAEAPPKSVEFLSDLDALVVGSGVSVTKFVACASDLDAIVVGSDVSVAGIDAWEAVIAVSIS